MADGQSEPATTSGAGAATKRRQPWTRDIRRGRDTYGDLRNANMALSQKTRQSVGAVLVRGTAVPGSNQPWDIRGIQRAAMVALNAGSLGKRYLRYVAKKEDPLNTPCTVS
jgi:hypothetical protein